MKAYSDEWLEWMFGCGTIGEMHATKMRDRIAELEDWQHQMIAAMLDMNYKTMVRLTMEQIKKNEAAGMTQDATK